MSSSCSSALLSRPLVQLRCRQRPLLEPRFHEWYSSVLHSTTYNVFPVSNDNNNHLSHHRRCFWAPISPSIGWHRVVTLCYSKKLMLTSKMLASLTTNAQMLFLLFCICYHEWHLCLCETFQFHFFTFFLKSSMSYAVSVVKSRFEHETQSQSQTRSVFTDAKWWNFYF